MAETIVIQATGLDSHGGGRRQGESAWRRRPEAIQLSSSAPCLRLVSALPRLCLPSCRPASASLVTTSRPPLHFVPLHRSPSVQSARHTISVAPRPSPRHCPRASPSVYLPFFSYFSLSRFSAFYFLTFFFDRGYGRMSLGICS